MSLYGSATHAETNNLFHIVHEVRPNVFGVSFERMVGMAISSMASAVILPLVFHWLAKSRQGTARMESKIAWLDYGHGCKFAAYAVLALLCALGSLAMWVEPEDRGAVVLLFFLFTAIGLPLVLEILFVRVGFDDTYIYCYSPWRLARAVRWQDLTACSYSNVNQWWVIDTTHLGRIRLSHFLSGLDSFFKMLNGKTDIPIDSP